MPHQTPSPLWCLAHQAPEDQPTPLGHFCRECKQHLYTHSPEGRLRAFWESQPAAYTLKREPLFVYSLMWDDFRVRSLHPAGSTEDPRSERAREYEKYRIEQERLDDAAEGIVPLEEDYSHLSISFGESSVGEESDSADDADAFAEAFAIGDEDDADEESWLDLPDPDSWLDSDGHSEEEVA